MKRRRLVLTVASVLLLLGFMMWGGLLIERIENWRRRPSRAYDCLSNTKDLAVAMRAYTADHDHRFPAADAWCGGLTPYIETEQLFVCPVTTDGGASYAMNRWIGAVRIDGLAPEQARDRHGTILDPVAGGAADAARVVILFGGPEGWNVAGGPEAVRYRHNDGANFGFADGHVKWGRRDDAYEWRWPAKLTPGTRDGAPAQP